MQNAYLIKRYGNRKLYDTVAKSYVTLEGIASLLREGHDVKVVDNDSGADLTTATFSQILLGNEKNHHGFLPKSVLTNLIQASGDQLGQLRRSVLGAPPPLQAMRDYVSGRLTEMVSAGELPEDEAMWFLGRLFPSEWRPPTLDELISHGLHHSLHQFNLPSREDVLKIETQLDALTLRLNRLVARTRARSPMTSDDE